MRQLKQLKTEAILDHRNNFLDEIDEAGRADEYNLPTHWTDYWAGSAEKVEVMRKRFEGGEQLHHPFDCKEILASSRS